MRELAAGPGVVLLCGRFEGIDERVIEGRALEEVSLGDFVLSGGEPAALALLDAVIRLLPGVMGADASGEDESFEGGSLGISALHRGPGPGKARKSCCSHLRRSRKGRGMAPGAIREVNKGTAARFVAKNAQRRSHNRLICGTDARFRGIRPGNTPYGLKRFEAMNIIQELEKEQIASLDKDIPVFDPGDTVQVNVKVVEGTRERIQAFEGGGHFAVWRRA